MCRLSKCCRGRNTKNCSYHSRIHQIGSRNFNNGCSPLALASHIAYSYFYLLVVDNSYLDLAIHTFANDSCVALKDYQTNPYNTALNSIIPCVDSQVTVSNLLEAQEGVHILINELNKKISMILGNLISTLQNNHSR